MVPIGARSPFFASGKDVKGMRTIARSSIAEAAIIRAEILAREIDELLRVAASEEAAAPGGSAYSIRVVQGVVRSLVDQLEELHPGPGDFLARTRAVAANKTHAA